MVSEIELALRAHIRIALSKDQIELAAKRCLASQFRNEDDLPRRLDEMTFDNYQSVIAHGENWKEFERIFGGNRTRTSAKLKEVGLIRNDRFHFKREITPT